MKGKGGRLPQLHPCKPTMQSMSDDLPPSSLAFSSKQAGDPSTLPLINQHFFLAFSVGPSIHTELTDDSRD